MTGMYAMHYAVSGCPIAAKNKVSGAQTKVCTYTSNDLMEYVVHSAVSLQYLC